MKTFRTSNKPMLKRSDETGSLKVPRKARIAPRTSAPNGKVRIVQGKPTASLSAEERRKRERIANA